MHVAHGKLPTESSVCVETVSTYLASGQGGQASSVLTGTRTPLGTLLVCPVRWPC